MKRFLIALFLIPSIAFAASGDSVYATTLDVNSALTTINAQCTTPATGCAAGQAVTLELKGRSSVTALVITANFTGTLAAFVSTDGSNWFSTLFRNGATVFAGVGANVASAALAANTATQLWSFVIPYKGIKYVMLANTAAATNSVQVRLTASNGADNPIPAMTTTKGVASQNNAVLPTQKTTDAGRSFVVLGADGVTPAIAETLITFAKNVAGTVTSAQTTYAITSTKTFRVQSVCASFTAGATANIARVHVRLNTGGACIASSGLLLPALELAPQYGTATASEGWASGCIAIPDGLDLTGASWNVCLSESAVAASGTLTVNLIGFEY